jgi:hypothetical protein
MTNDMLHVIRAVPVYLEALVKFDKETPQGKISLVKL